MCRLKPAYWEVILTTIDFIDHFCVDPAVDHQIKTRKVLTEFNRNVDGKNSEEDFSFSPRVSRPQSWGFFDKADGLLSFFSFLFLQWPYYVVSVVNIIVYLIFAQVWQCHGKLVDAPCSRVGHIYRCKYVPFPNPGFGDFISRNYKRVAEVWMDEYKHFLYERRPAMKTADLGECRGARVTTTEIRIHPSLSLSSVRLICVFTFYTGAESRKLNEQNYC